ncbi:MAG: cysteine peptidase family C39 domain-containing protein [Synechococcales bacterium]|nr:cysteine peptidase family C39 domain-containing protein [Synechococcales bacterium]
MLIGATVNFLLGTLLFTGGVRCGLMLLRRGATANDLFKGKTPLSLAFLGIYVFFLVLILNLPQMEILPLEWRFHGMKITWSLMRIMLLGICGVAITVSWYTARRQVVAIALLGILGLGGFIGAECYLFSPIHASLTNNLQASGVFRQTSDSSCAPAALATLLRVWDISTTESRVAELAQTSRMGTSMPQLIMAAQSFGMDGRDLSPDLVTLRRINRPGILSVWLISGDRQLPHAVALLGIDDQTYFIADPAYGKIFALSQQEFTEIWRQEYVPIFRPSELFLTQAETVHYLQSLGYLPSSLANAGEASVPSRAIARALAQFQEDHGLWVTGALDDETRLILTGPFLENTPTLKTVAASLRASPPS